jgi:hypothetical protein
MSTHVYQYSDGKYCIGIVIAYPCTNQIFGARTHPARGRINQYLSL